MCRHLPRPSSCPSPLRTISHHNVPRSLSRRVPTEMFNGGRRSRGLVGGIDLAPAVIQQDDRRSLRDGSIAAVGGRPGTREDLSRPGYPPPRLDVPLTRAAELQGCVSYRPRHPAVLFGSPSQFPDLCCCRACGCQPAMASGYALINGGRFCGRDSRSDRSCLRRGYKPKATMHELASCLG